jgi:hypothetical protein
MGKSVLHNPSRNKRVGRSKSRKANHLHRSRASMNLENTGSASSGKCMRPALGGDQVSWRASERG